jgi:hypothetical protein
MADDTIKVEFDYSDIQGKTPDQKIDLLLKIAWSNHNILQQHGKILFGNGEAGLCDVARENKRGLKLIYWLFFGAASGFAGVLYTHLMGK